MIVIGASAGGLEPLREILRSLPTDLHAAVLVVMHTSAESPGLLADIIARDAQLITFKAGDGMNINPGRIYVAPPDRHMLVNGGKIRLDRGPTENRHRPAINPLFRSAAAAYGPAVAAVVLSGYLDDGTLGLQAVKAHGGVAVVQDPDEAIAPSMPLNAIEHNEIDYLLASGDIAPLLVRLANGNGNMTAQKTTRKQTHGESRKPVEHAAASVFSCPDCHGVLLEVHEHGITQYRCRIGHVYSVDALVEGQRDAVERAMWAAVRSLEEDAELAQRIYEKAAMGDKRRAAEHFLRRTEVSRKNADVIRGILLGENSPVQKEPSVDETTEKVDDSAA